MNLDVLIKYIIWIVVFGLVLTALYFMFKKFGIL